MNSTEFYANSLNLKAVFAITYKHRLFFYITV